MCITETFMMLTLKHNAKSVHGIHLPLLICLAFIILINIVTIGRPHLVKYILSKSGVFVVKTNSCHNICSIFLPLPSLHPWSPVPGRTPGSPNGHALYCTALDCSALYWVALYCTALYLVALYYITLYCTGIHYTALLCTTLHCRTLHSTTLHYFALHNTLL